PAPAPTPTPAPPRGASPLLSVRGVDAGYGALDVLFAVDLHVAEGEIVALLGTNGAGKSTLLRVVAGLLAPRHGSVLLAGRDVSGVPAHRLAAQGVALAPGREGVFPTLSVNEHLRLAAGRGPRRTRADSATEVRRRAFDTFPALARRAREQAGNLSGGEQQMLSLALALVGRPRLLLVDELSLGLSPAVLDELLDVLSALR